MFFVISAVILGYTILARSYSQNTLLTRKLLPTKEYNPYTQDTFSVLQFNTLADSLCDSKSFPHSDQSILQWSFRKEKLVQEILQLNADVVQLEEVDHFEMFQEKLKPVYEGIFKKKNSVNNKDGCAFFYKKDKFYLLKYEFVEYDKQQSQVAILANLKLKNSNNHFIFAMTHLKAKQGYEDVRLKQGYILLQRLNSFIHSLEKKPDGIIISGDFNDVPSSKLYQLFATGKAESDLKEIFTHNFILKSAYSNYDKSGVEPYTTYKKRETEVRRCIDYIWYEEEKLKVNRLLEIPNYENLKDRLPCAQYPSDHLAIMAEFQITTSNQ